MDTEVRERFERIEATLDRASSLMMECVQNYHEMNKTLAEVIAVQAENSKLSAENAKQIAQNTMDIAELREAIRLSLQRPPKNGHSD